MDRTGTPPPGVNEFVVIEENEHLTVESDISQSSCGDSQPIDSKLSTITSSTPGSQPLNQFTRWVPTTDSMREAVTKSTDILKMSLSAHKKAVSAAERVVSAAERVKTLGSDKLNNLAIHYVKNGNLDALKSLASSGMIKLTDVKEVSRLGAGRTLLELAAQLGEKEIVDLILDLSDSISPNTIKDAIMNAAHAGEPEIVLHLSRRTEIPDKEYTNITKTTAISLFNKQELPQLKATPIHKNALEALVALLGEIKSRTETHAKLYADSDRSEAPNSVDTQITWNIDSFLSMQFYGGKTPLHFAAESGSDKVVNKMLSLGARTDIPDHEGHFPLHTAVKALNLETSAILFKQNPEQVTLTDKHGDAIVHMLGSHIRGFEQETVSIERLITQMSDIPQINWNQRNKRGDTLLHLLACGDGYSDGSLMVNTQRKVDFLPSILSIDGVEPNLLNKKNQSPLDVALCTNGNYQLLWEREDVSNFPRANKDNYSQEDASDTSVTDDLKSMSCTDIALLTLAETEQTPSEFLCFLAGLKLVPRDEK